MHLRKKKAQVAAQVEAKPLSPYDILQLSGGHLQPLDLDELLEPVHDEQVLLVVVVANVPGVEPVVPEAVSVNGRRNAIGKTQLCRGNCFAVKNEIVSHAT